MESRIELGRRFEKQRVVLDRRQPCYDSDSKGSIRKAPSAPLRNTRRLVHDRECGVCQKVRNFDDLLPGHPFLADKKIGHTATVRQDTMGEQGAPAIDRLQLGPRYLGPPPPTTGDNGTPAKNTSPGHGENIAIDVVRVHDIYIPASQQSGKVYPLDSGAR